MSVLCLPLNNTQALPHYLILSFIIYYPILFLIHYFILSFRILYLVFLVSLQQGLCPCHILGQLISRDDCLHVMDPADQVTVVRQEAMQVVGVIQTGTTLLSLTLPTLISTIHFSFIIYFLFLSTLYLVRLA